MLNVGKGIWLYFLQPFPYIGKFVVNYDLLSLI